LVGDLGGPALLALFAGDWRITFAITGGVLAVWAAIACATPIPQPVAGAASDEDHEPPLWQALRDALTDRVLVAWLFATALCELLDEILIVFASIHLRDDLGASVTYQSVTIGAFVLGGAGGLIALDRVLVRFTEKQLLVASGLACAACYLAWLAMPTPLLAAIAIAPVGVTAAPLYPLAAAQAYARRPGRSGVVLAASHLFTPLGLALPWLLGLVADHAGTRVALALLVGGPLGIAALAAQRADRPTPAVE
ncbi:MAG TPA: MFS transporter, partial [Kofleriaceae bacterium]